MKSFKYLIFFLFVGALISCSSDDADNQDDTNMGTSEILSLRIGDTDFEFDTIVVTNVTGNGLDLVSITGTMSNSTSQTISISFVSDDLGSGTFENFSYNLDGTGCSNYQGNMNYNLSTNNSSEIVGTFSGEVNCNGDDDDERIISNGIINISL